MALFGSKKRGLFEPPASYATPGIGDNIIPERMGGGLGAPVASPEPQSGGFASQFFGPGFGDRLARAAAFMQGDYDGAAQITRGMRQERALSEKMAQQERQRQMLMASLKAQGLSDQQAALVLANAANIGDFRPKEAAPPAFVKNYEAWQNMTPEQRKGVASMQSVLNPRYVIGPDGLPYQAPIPGVSSAPPARPVGKLTPLPQGGPTPSASGGFRR